MSLLYLLNNKESTSLKESLNKKQGIEVISCTVLDLFQCKNRTIPFSDISGEITIPEYQRPYLWSTKDVEKLIVDLEDYFNNTDANKPMYYLGSIILHQKNNKLNIIDGQQRITTIALIEAALNNELPAITYDSPISIYNIQNNFKILCSENNLPKLKEINLLQINVTLIITYNEDDAYTFFETQNTGGVRLTGVDIIKAHHLRDVIFKGSRQDQYAHIWENAHNLPTVIECLIKARRWSVLNWVSVPSDRDLKGTKRSIIEEFSEWTLPSKEKNGYQHVQLSDNYCKLAMQSSPLAIRQPLANGENFIDYVKVFTDLNKKLFHQKDDAEIPDEYFTFDKSIIKAVDGTAFLKEFYEIAILCYASRFGFANILEASYWIFRYCYSPRVINQTTVREDSIPAFIRNNNFLFDQILYSFNHKELIKKLSSFPVLFNIENVETNHGKGHSVKRRFINLVDKYFEFTPGWNLLTDYDKQLKLKIKEKLDGENV